MELGLQGKSALVMASSKGLGRAVALELAQEGCEVLICGRDLTALKETADHIVKSTGTKAHFVVGDITQLEERDHICEEAKNKFGTVDILVTNTGGPPPGPFEVHDRKAWETAYRSLVESAVEMIRSVVPGMKAQNWGRIIMVTSQAVRQPVEGLVLSNALRGALTGLMKTLANELGPYQITVNNVLPGYTRTERLTKLIETNPKYGEAVNEIPLGRFGEVAEFGAAVAFLASQKAAYITGISLPVDGGWIKGI
ncbi:SDR family oxidoreductase [Galbibacter sp. PAP.153]|uniref:SDR family oxidoreductase n=1 Tax=Galbibacter sp. PAP.153 TaxID=3104623 RepID=UPI003008D1B7